MLRSFFYFLGNSIILLTAAGYLTIFWPFLMLFVSHPHYQAILDKGFSISIPKINASARVIPAVDPWRESVYRSALQKGVAQAKGTSLPGQKGTIFLFAHSSDLPWRMTRYNTPFLRLGELKTNDLIIIVYNGKQFYYHVINQKIVWPNEIQYLTYNKKDQLILQTCYPIGTSLQRLLIFAQQQK